MIGLDATLPIPQGASMTKPSAAHGLVLAVALACLATHASAAPTMPASGRGTTLYYRLGGSDAAARAPNPSNLSLHLGLSGAARFNYSCGKFSATLSLQNALNAFAGLGPVVTAAVQAGIAALPMYILQRAQPGLYELIQTYIKKAEELVNLSFASCEQMEQMARDGKNPYDKYVSLAMGEAWKQQAAGGGDVIQAKQTVQTNAGASGFTWVFGSMAGGNGLPAARIVNDTVTASYNLTMMQPTTASPLASYAAGGTRLAKAFPTPASAATYATDVLGDLEVATCDGGSCPAKATRTAVGLERKVEEEMPVAKAQLATALAAAVPTSATLDAASAPGVLVTRDLVEALRALHAAERSIAVEKLGQEIALARTVDRALLVRQMLVTGMTIPEALPEQVTDEVQKKVAQVNRAIDDLLFETRVRKEVMSSSAITLLEAYRAAQSASGSNAPAASREQRPFVDGRVQ
jgi:integrating conjugative element protein (TIGR03755 family)